MDIAEVIWTALFVLGATLAIGAIFYVSWRFVRNAEKGNRWFRLRRQPTRTEEPADRSESSRA
jgi:hypothetical protein